MARIVLGGLIILYFTVFLDAGWLVCLLQNKFLFLLVGWCGV